ncbi:hypothetical protein BASA50_001180 [Batrachochytrium salamandrivorans]|uniref:Uncharacterized protein n=1 Tax=Batrachochytrium salamandrivorans TaxID=1357716 RepID=A0ABQ8ESW4_9FUNG|nr:hypothetical protein BASA50_001180 [Batrachochytrium salamandrivorans]KAH9248866.1 hypothetical protein BASA81_013476 [Batrachochytrium salamandrivorans]
MKLAIASTTFLFAMMAAQAAVLSATSNTDVNLAKRAPNGDDETGQGPTVDQSSSVLAPQTPLTEHEKSQVDDLRWIICGKMGKSQHSIDLKQALVSETKKLIDKTKRKCERNPLFASTKARAKIAEFKKTLVGLEKALVEFEQELKTAMEEYKKTKGIYLDLKQAALEQNYSYIKSRYLRNQKEEVL